MRNVFKCLGNCAHMGTGIAATGRELFINKNSLNRKFDMYVNVDSLRSKWVHIAFTSVIGAYRSGGASNSRKV